MSAFERRHYEAIAYLIANEGQNIGNQTPESMRQNIARALTALFIADNPRFNARKFLTAASCVAELPVSEGVTDDSEYDMRECCGGGCHE